MKIAAIPILLTLLLALPIACDALNPAPTATPIPPPTIEPATAPNPEPAATATPAPTHTPQPAPTATPVPTATPAPTATPQPTPTSRPTATPRPRPTPTRRPTATPAPQLESRTEIIVPAGETRSYQVRVPADGYLYYSFTSVEHLNESEVLDIDFKIFGPLFDYFQRQRHNQLCSEPTSRKRPLLPIWVRQHRLPVRRKARPAPLPLVADTTRQRARYPRIRPTRRNRAMPTSQAKPRRRELRSNGRGNHISAPLNRR